MLQMAGRMQVLGTETAFEVLARANALAAQGRSIINLGIGQPDFPTPEHIVEAGRKALADGHHGYTPANGIPPLREAVAADLYRRHKVEVSPDLVLVVPGGKVTMFFAIMMFGEAGTEILYPNPGFPIYESVIRFSGATPVPVPLYESKGFSFSADEVLEKITPQTRLLIINSPANPTGGVVPRAELDRLVAGLERHPQVAVMSDEIYGEILYDGAEHVSLLQLSVLARAADPARRLEQDLCDDRLADGLWRVAKGAVPPRRAACDQLPFLRQCGGAICRDRGAGRPARAGSSDGPRLCRAARDDRRGAEWPARHYAAPTRAARSTPFRTSPGPATTPAASRAELLDQEGVATIAGTSFGEFGENYIRFSYANSLEAITEAIERIRRFLGNAPHRDAAEG